MGGGSILTITNNAPMPRTAPPAGPTISYVPVLYNAEISETNPIISPVATE